MYTIGQVAKFLGISRDTLKFYEEKNLINPMQDEENGYRKYNVIDINEVITINFYRDIDIEVKKIQEIKKSESLDTIESILDEKQQKLKEEIEYKQVLLKRIEGIKENFESIKTSLNNMNIREMKPIVITSEINMKKDVAETYGEILNKYDYSIRLKKAVSLSGISRIVYFNNEAITKERYVFYERVYENVDETREVISYPKCLYIVIAIPINHEESTDNIDEKMGAAIFETANELGYKAKGVAFINLLFNGYKDKGNIQYLEVYAPVE
ncbi:MerR family transcriptional regulator [Clostridium sp. LIBA-8841]|uniref:MerR family transcriptional regulator n=1 Tax=Clostridium sp. LIBA-8841 TaxID=2987530 RepID=UPI002AC377B6|nr:MerR family transcriptional regulator [Clostridium sp. LIBA-8841]MDZ5254068.1 MerR family transcriptional regulator [Clostridium sp. LIBA-8841]